MLWVLNYSDGGHDLLDIAERSGFSMETIVSVAGILEELKKKVGTEYSETHNYELAAQLFTEISLEEDFTDFLTLKAYAYLD